MTHLETTLPSCEPLHTPPNEYILLERIQTLEAQNRQQAEEMRKLHLWNEQQSRTIRQLRERNSNAPSDTLAH